MNRLEFMARLEKLLAGISPSEREEALQYYNEYFNDAGVENEDGVIEALGSPEAVASTILAGLAEGAEIGGEFSEKGFVPVGTGRTAANALQKVSGNGPEGTRENAGNTGTAGYGQAQTASGQGNAGAAGRKKKKKAWGIGTILLVVLLSICAAPFLIPFAFAAFLIVVCMVLVLFLLLLSAGLILGSIVLVGVVLFFTGIVLVGVGIAKLFVAPFGGLWIAGSGLGLAGIGLLLTVGFLWVLIKVAPALIRGIVWLCGLPFRKRRKGEAK